MNPLTILIVDDDPDMRLYLRSCLRFLSSVGQVLEAADGKDALELTGTHDVDLVISDVVLPRLDGFGLCRAIKSDPKLRHLPVLLVSGKERRFPSQFPADAFLAKPFNASQLHAVLAPLVIRRNSPLRDKSTGT